MKQLNQTITVVNKSGVVVKNSKQLVNVFKEAKAAYSAKKAELQAGRNSQWDERQVRKGLQGLDLDDGASRRSGQQRRTHGKERSTPRSGAHSGRGTPRRSNTERRPQQVRDDDSYYARPEPIQRGYSDSFYANDVPPFPPSEQASPAEPHLVRRKPTRYEQDLAGRELQRRHTDNEYAVRRSSQRRSFEARHSAESFDADLAYGELPPPLPVRRLDDEQELRGKMTLLTRMLEEAHCVQHSATATIEHLQKNPDALAAVALTLAEAANLARKMAPGALGGLAKAFPAAMALLASPQFLIAAGLGVGVTVVMLGGYKIIKRIKDKKETERELEAPMQLQEIEPALSQIEMWRRGIADEEAQSVGTTVDGEFITPAAKSRGLEEGWLRPENLRDPTAPSRSGSERGKPREAKPSDKKRSRRGERSDRSVADSARSNASKRSDNSKRSDSSTMSRRKTVVKGVKMLFQGRTIPPSERER